jgi:hypothetical protein
MRNLTTKATTFFATLRILTREDFVHLLWYVHDGGKWTKWALFQAGESCLKLKP